MTTSSIIRFLREERDLTQTELAELVKINRSVLNRIELGTRPVRDDELKRLAAFFGVSTDYLLGLTDNPVIQILQTDESTPFGRAVAKAKQSYYNDPKVAAIVDELKNRPGMRILFDASRDLSEEDIKFVTQLVERMKKGKSNE